MKQTKKETNPILAASTTPETPSEQSLGVFIPEPVGAQWRLVSRTVENGVVNETLALKTTGGLLVQGKTQYIDENGTVISTTYTPHTYLPGTFINAVNPDGSVRI